MEKHKALLVFIIVLIFTFASGIGVTLINSKPDSVFGLFSILGIFGSIISFIAALVEAFNK